MPAASFLPFQLQTGRAHEVCGPGALFFAFAWVARRQGNAIWIRERWRPDRINPDGFSEFVDPDRLLMVEAGSQTEVLAVAEDALRAGAVPMVVLELNSPTDLTAGRRLQLAARDGGTTVLAIIPEGMGSNATETRWFCAPVFDPADSTLQRWDLIKNKKGTLGCWHVRWDAAARRLDVVSPAGERPGPEGASG